MARRGHSTYKKYTRKEFIRDRKPLIVVFIIAAAVVLACAAAFFVQQQKSRETVYYSEIEDCTLPVISFIYHDMNVNRIFGYTSGMDIKYIRDNICILDDPGSFDLNLEADMYGNTARTLEFYLYDLEEEKLIQHDSVKNMEQDGDVLRCRLAIENFIEQGREYTMDIKMTDTTGREIHYYTRLMQNTTSPVYDMLNLALDHHDAMYDKEKRGFLDEFQEPNSAVNDSTNFGYITLNSTLNSMSWGTMGVKVITEPVVSIVDVDNDIGFFRLVYQVGRVSEAGEKEYYNVSEYYRNRQYGDKRFILSYERRVDQIFVPNASNIGNKSVQIGIDEDLAFQIMTNSRCNMNVFVAGKSVWFMDSDTKTLQKVFSFENDPTDIRQNHAQHDIRLLKITDSGDFQFIVYGYMNRGLHEGRAGIGLYTYSAEKNEVREDIFIPSHVPYQILKNSIGSLCYLNNKGILYILLDEYVYSLDSASNKAKLLVSGLDDNNFKVSDNGRMLAWQDQGINNEAVRINVADLEEETSYFITADEGKCIKVLGFLDNDLVYGSGEKGHTYVTTEGEEYLLMDDLFVVNRNKEVQSSEHSSRGFFVTSSVEYNRVVVNRVARVGSEYKKGDEFTLFSTDLESHPSASIYNVYDEDRRTVNYLEVVNYMEPNRPAVINDSMKITLSSAEAADVGGMISDSGKYYVYAAGDIIDIMTSPSDAIMRAYYSTGVVINGDGYFYRRSSRPITSELTEASIKRAADEYRAQTALNITGVYLRQALYYTGRKIPVVWEWDDTAYVICGYDLFDNLTLRSVETGEEILVAYEDVDAIFDESGRCFIVM